ncbi:hypothetical protein LWI29_007138 [Acer saccharum]|uniref:Tf2-1-like SH3-like domain-containing protein n=1 Tax=Acer saccharum TaxID=4024 RepID=A0AA39RTZ1_ACESA|nr:hypothetical protein LWI29_007138 [Acer saccharum]
MKVLQSRQKSYADNQRKHFEFANGDNVFLKVAPMKGVMRFSKKGKPSPRFVGLFEILERIGDLAYRLALPPSLARGENSAIQECNFWLDTFDTPILPYETELTTSIPLEPESTIFPPEPESTIPLELEPNTNSSTPARTQSSVDKELIVYSRRKIPQEEIKDRTLPEQNHESDPSPSPSLDIPGNTSQTDISINDDLDIPIALRKGVRSCTQHLISNFVSYDGLSLEYRAFATNLSNIEIPRAIKAVELSVDFLLRASATTFALSG